MANINKIGAMFDSVIDNVLVKAAEKIANDARAGAPTRRIKANINISPVERTPEGRQIKIEIPLDDAPEARAYEYGSGIHATRSEKSPNQRGDGEIDIYAVNYPNLIFYWQKKDRMFVGPHVTHPGVAPKPYLAPAVRKNRNTILGLLSRGLGSLIKSTIVTGFQEKST